MWSIPKRVLHCYFNICEVIMLKVNFHNCADDNLLKFAVIVARHNGRWVFCKHKERNTYECPGGHRECGENIDDTAKRELWEETGAVNYNLIDICAYSVTIDNTTTFGMLYYADIFEFESLPPLEIEKIEFFKELPTNWTYPLIQPKLITKVQEIIG